MSQKAKGRAAKTEPEIAFKEAIVPYVSKKAAATSRVGKNEEDQGWIDFRDQCRRQMERPMELRIKYGFCRMYKPVLDDAPWRAFNTMAEYRDWCEKNLPAYLGFKRPTS